MAILNNNPLVGASGNQGGYNINNSLRFRSSASAYLSRTPASAGNRKTFTWSAWVKRGALGSDYGIFSAGTNSSNAIDAFEFNSSNQIRLYSYNSAYLFQYVTTAVYRDPSAWYHIVVAVDTTQATAGNRVKLYVNGQQVTAFSTQTDPTQNSDCNFFNTANLHAIGATYNNSRFLDGYQTDINFIDGSAKTPSDFGETDTTTGVWKPKAYSGTYGTNGFYLKFSDIATTSGSNAGLGKDFSGNSNYWTTNNISVTSGTTYDAMTDSPTNTSATVANYCTWNPNDALGTTTSSANLNAVYNASGYAIRGTMAYPSTGKWYYEMTQSGTGDNFIGLSPLSATLSNLSNASTGFYAYYSGAYKYTNGVATSYGATFGNNDVIGVAVDCDAGTVTFYKNNTSQGTAFTGLDFSVGWQPMARVSGSGVTAQANFGQRSFAYTPPTGYVALNTYNLPTPTILQGNKYMDATLYTGTGSSQSISGVNFQPDFVWIKERSGVADHGLYDAVRGVQKQLESNTTTAETTETTGLTAFNSNGFTVGALAQLNTNTDTYVGWSWKANGAGSSNTAGTITSTVSASTTAGFSVFTYTGNATTDATIGHGLGVTPKMFIIKARSTTSEGLTYHVSTGKNGFLQLFNTDAFASSANYWGSTGPTSTTIQINGGGGVNNSGTTYVVWCWAEIAGFSKFGSYTGNGSTDGPFVFTNFRPKYVMIKQSAGTSAGSGNWMIQDTSRNPFNQEKDILAANLSNAEFSDPNYGLDGLSNGFKIRSTNVNWNESSGTYIFMAFAENPFKNALAR